MKNHAPVSCLLALAALTALGLLAARLEAQQLAPPPVGSTPAPITPAVPAPVGGTAPTVPAVPVPGPAPAPVEPAPAPVAPVSASVTPPPKAAATGGIMLNFQGASLKDVLNYLSDAAGFVIVQEVPVTGTVNIVSRQPIGAEDAVDLLNTVLADKGFTAIRNGRILKIVSRKDAPKKDLPVKRGNNPEDIPRDDAVVTWILPLRFGEAAKVIENLRPLLSDDATVTANEASNALIMTDKQANIRRIATILKALDESVSSISTITVFQLEFADAKAVAETITQLYATPQQSGANGRGGGGGGRGGPFGGMFGGFGGGGGGGAGGGGANAAATSEARLASTKVVAVADEQSNSVIVSSPEAMVPGIRELIQKIDISINDVSQTRIFRLQHADSVELADILTNLFSDSSTQRSRNQNNNNNGRRNGGGGGFGFGGGGGQAQPASTQSERSLLQAKVVAVGDPRTNSLVVTAANDSMLQIEDIVKRLDATEAKKQRVFVYHLKNADADPVAGVLRGIINGDTTGTSTTNTNSVLQNRQRNGATNEGSLNSSSNSGSGSGTGLGGGGRSSR